MIPLEIWTAPNGIRYQATESLAFCDGCTFGDFTLPACEKAQRNGIPPCSMYDRIIKRIGTTGIIWKRINP